MKNRSFDHTADWGLEITAASGEELFAGAAFALFDLITDPTAVRAGQSRRIAVTGKDETDLFVNFLREVLYAWNGERFLMKSCGVQRLANGCIEALLRGESFDPDRHRIKTEIKAITYHQASVKKTPEGWIGRVILDV